MEGDNDGVWVWETEVLCETEGDCVSLGVTDGVCVSLDVCVFVCEGLLDWLWVADAVEDCEPDWL